MPVLLWIFGAIVIVALGWPLAALVRGIGTQSQNESALPLEKTKSRSVGMAVVVAMAILIALLLLSVWMGRRAASPRQPSVHAATATTTPAAGG